MNNPRLEKLYEWVKNTPNDPFLTYAIGLELLNIDLEKSKSYFDKLLIEFPDYLPTYYQAGKLYERLNQEEKALEIYQNGINLGTQVKDAHAVSELTGAYNFLKMELSDDEW